MTLFSGPCSPAMRRSKALRRLAFSCRVENSDIFPNFSANLSSPKFDALKVQNLVFIHFPHFMVSWKVITVYLYHSFSDFSGKARQFEQRHGLGEIGVMPFHTLDPAKPAPKHPRHTAA